MKIKYFARILLAFIITIIFPAFVVLMEERPVYAVTRTLYWVGGTDTWNATAGAKWSLASGGASGEAVPDSDDDVIIDSFSSANAITMAYASVVCRDLDFTGGAGPFAGDIVSFGGSIYGSLTMSATMDITSYVSSYTTFKATTAGKTITTNGIELGRISFDGVGGEWTLQDNVTTYRNVPSATGNLGMSDGSLITNNKTIALASGFGQTGGAIDFGTSVITYDGVWSISGGTQTNLNTASITGAYVGNSVRFYGGGKTYGDVILTTEGTGATWSGQITGANTFANLTILAANSTGFGGDPTGPAMNIFADQIVTGTLIMTGYNSSNKRLNIMSDTLGTSRQITAAAFTITNCNLRDISAGNPTWDISAGINSDYGHNFGITFTVPQNNYWVGNSGNWSDVNHWSTATDGTGGGTGRVPIIQDTAVFNSHSLTWAGVVTMDVINVCTIDASTVSNTPTFSATTIYVYGSLNLGIATWTVTTTSFNSPNPSTIISASNLAAITVDTISGVCSLESDVTSTAAITLTSGVLDLNGFDLTASTFVGTGTTTRQMLLGEGTFTLNATGAVTKWNAAATGFTLTRESGTIVLTSSGANAQTFAGGGMTYGNVNIQGAGNYILSITGANTFADLTIYRNEAAKTVKFPTSSTTTVSNFYVPISGVVVVTLVGSTAPPTANVWTISKTAGVVVTDYLSIEDSTAQGGASFYSGSHSTHVSHVTGWNLSDPTTPIVSTSSATNVISNTATLNGSLDTLDGVSSGYAFFQYGLTTSYGTNTLEQAMATTGTFLQAIAGLDGSTTYHYRAAFKYSGLTYFYGADVTFTTMAAPAGAPTVVTGSATDVTQTTAKLQGSLTSLGIYTPIYVYFEYKSTGAWTATTEITETAVGGYSHALTGLTAGTTYYYRAVARYNVSNYVYGATVSFSFSTLEIPTGKAKAFRGYLETGDLLICVEYINNQAPYAPSEDPKIYFAMQLLSIDGTTILASTPLPHWGNKVTSIYLSAASSSNITDGGAYIIRMMGLYTSPASVSYTLTASDWRGSNMNRLDDWVIGAAWSINAYYELTGEDMIVTSVPGKPQCITEKSEGIFTSGIPYIKQKRPGIFQSTGISTTLFGGTPNLAFDESKSWEEEVGPLVASDMDDMGNIFGITGRNFNGLMVAGIGVMAVGALLSSGITIVSGVLVLALVGITGAQFRAIDIQWLLVPVVIFCLIFVAGYFWDRS